MTESANDRYEHLAAAFQRETGMMAPGKDQPPELGGPSFEERAEAWDTWIKRGRATYPVLDAMKERSERLIASLAPSPLPTVDRDRDRLLALVEQLVAALERIRDLHRDHGGVCYLCEDVGFPCPTRWAADRALTALKEMTP